MRRSRRRYRQSQVRILKEEINFNDYTKTNVKDAPASRLSMVDRRGGAMTCTWSWKRTEWSGLLRGCGSPRAEVSGTSSSSSSMENRVFSLSSSCSCEFWRRGSPSPLIWPFCRPPRPSMCLEFVTKRSEECRVDSSHVRQRGSSSPLWYFGGVLVPSPPLPR